MSRVFAIHEYELRHDTDSQEFEQVLKDILLSKELDMPGLESRHLLKGYKGERKSKYSVLWIFKSQETLEELFGNEEKPKRGPVNFVNFEDNILSKFLDRPADQIVFTDYLELSSRGWYHHPVQERKVTKWYASCCRQCMLSTIRNSIVY